MSGRVMHARHVAPRLRFGYRIWMLAFDLDRIGEVAADVRGFAHNSFAPVALHDRDHGPRDGSSLRDWVAGRLAEAGLSAYAARIHFVVIPRVLGFGFNPISCYFCFDDSGRLGAILHQVKNTFGDQHGYLLPVADPGDLRHSAAKRMHVSPFHDLAGGYRFTCRAPDFITPQEPGPADERASLFTLAIAYGTAQEPRMTAVMRLRAAPLTTARLWRMVFAMPLVPFKVIAAIHWQALRLWLRGAHYHPAPPPPGEPVSLGGHP